MRVEHNPQKVRSGMPAFSRNNIISDELGDKSVSEHTIHRQGSIHIDTSQNREKSRIS